MTAIARFSAEEISAANVAGLTSQSRWDCDFVINGRFLSQPVTGVQRYAREVVTALDFLLGSTNGRGRILAPRNVEPSNDFKAIDVSRVGVARGHLWEQLELPLRAERPILNLCNVGPAYSARPVVCIHDVNVFLEPKSYTLAFRAGYKTLLPRLAKNAAVVTTVSHASRQTIARYLPAKVGNIVVIPNGHEHCFRWSALRSKLKTDLKLTRPFVFMLGSRARHKNLDIILRMSDALDARDIELVVAGGSANIYSTTQHPHRSNIRWLGTVTDDDLAFLYSRAMCLAFPSLSEGFGLPIVEAMALGCPVVTSNRGSMLEVAGGAALLAAPDDPGSWLAHFQALKASPSLGRELRESGFERVKRFSWSGAARAYLDLFGHRT